MLSAEHNDRELGGNIAVVTPRMASAILDQEVTTAQSHLLPSVQNKRDLALEDDGEVDRRGVMHPRYMPRNLFDAAVA